MREWFEWGTPTNPVENMMDYKDGNFLVYKDGKWVILKAAEPKLEEAQTQEL